MIGARDQGEIVSLFYEAAIGSVPWETALARIAELFRSQATLFAVHRPRSTEVAEVRSHNYGREFLDGFFRSEVHAHDPRAARIAAVSPGSIYFDEMLYDPEAMAADAWVRAAIDMLKVRAQVGVRLRLPHGGDATLGILRRDREPDALIDRVRAIAGLAPRIEQACQVGFVVERERVTRDALLACLAAKADAVLLLDRSGRAGFLNPVAERLLAAGDGLAFRDGAFVCARRPETEALRGLVAAALAGEPGAGGRMLVSRASRAKPYVVSVLVPPAHEAFLTGGSIACIVHVEDLADPPAPSPADLAVLGLTAREAVLGAALVRTARLDAAAAECKMALNTARNHLQAIFLKTGTNSQAELVQLLGRIL